jgi:hypothetical protein
MVEQALYYATVHVLDPDCWYCEVVTEDGSLMHCTASFDTEAKAIVSAQRWVFTASLAEEPRR